MLMQHEVILIQACLYFAEMMPKDNLQIDYPKQYFLKLLLNFDSLLLKRDVCHFKQNVYYSVYVLAM